MALRSTGPPCASLLAILLMAKSAWLSTTPLLLMRMKISVTVSMSRSAFSSITPICRLAKLASWPKLRSTTSGSAPGLAAVYSLFSLISEKPLPKNTLMSGNQCLSFWMMGVCTSKRSSSGWKAILILMRA